MNLATGDTRLIIDVCKKHGLLRNQAAYLLATAWHETARTMKPVRETLAKSDAKAKEILTKAWKAGKLSWVKKDYWSSGYFGRGYVQLTHPRNYKLAGEKLGVNLVKNPYLAMDPKIAAEVLVRGSKEGWFTGKRLVDYITQGKSDYVNARRIINGTDRASVIAGYAKQYEALLTADGYGAGQTKPVERDEPRSQPNEFDSIMHRGSRGQFVTELQQNLNTLGYGPVKVDGSFGKETEAAVVQFQHDAGLKPDGWAGPRTLEAIGRAIKDRETAPKIAAAKGVVDDAASNSISKTEVITTVTGVGGVATVVKETVDSVKDGASSLLSLGPWILLALVIAGGAAFVIWDRRRKRLAANAAKAVM